MGLGHPFESVKGLVASRGTLKNIEGKTLFLVQLSFYLLNVNSLSTCTFSHWHPKSQAVKGRHTPFSCYRRKEKIPHSNTIKY